MWLPSNQQTEEFQNLLRLDYFCNTASVYFLYVMLNQFPILFHFSWKPIRVFSRNCLVPYWSQVILTHHQIISFII